MTFHPAGSTEGGTVVLWYDAKSAQINVDPVAGAVIIR